MRRLLGSALVVLAVTAVLPPAGAQPGTPDPIPAAAAVAIEAVSNRADLISGGDVLLDVVVTGADPGGVRVTAAGRDVTGAFRAIAPDRLRGLVEGLPPGRSLVEAVLPDGRGARLGVTDHPLGGPVFAGPQVQPWLCETEAAGLGAPTDDQCSAPTRITYLYRSAVTGQFQDYDPEAPPADVATTTTDHGVTVPYVVRLETGTMDRGIHQIAVLADPSADWTALDPQPQWNGKVVWPFGGGTGPEHKQNLPGGLLVDAALSRGFMTASSSLNVHGQNANDTVSAEVVMMLQEHIAETYGPIRYTIGTGCSGGGLQQHIIADTYPGLLDGLLPNCSYPDIWTTAMEVADCALLVRYFDETAPELWAAVQQRAFVAGHQDVGSCISWDALFAPRFDATLASNCALPAELVYHPQTNPTGVRCTLNDYQRAIWGPRAAAERGEAEAAIGRGFAARPVSNVGVQYGLDALADGLITAEQFVDLNARVGGYDIDGVPIPDRTPASAGSAAVAYRTGQVVLGHALDQVPIIDLRGHDNTEIHTDVYSHVMAERLVAANGHADNQAIWTGPIPLLGEASWVQCGESIASGTGGGQELPTAPVPCAEDSPLLVMDRWLTAIEADASGATLEEKVLANRPAEAVDACFVADQAITEAAACAAAYPVFRTTRMVAGGPAANDVIDCALAPLDRDAHPGTFTDEQWARMEAAFPDGVCDYSRPGTGYQPPRATWLAFPGDGAAPVPLGPPPTSVPFGPGSGSAERVAGPDRVATAVELSRLAHPDGAGAVVLARADDFPDALTAAALAAAVDGPLLLTGGEALDDRVAVEVARLGAREVLLVGGSAALSPEVEAAAAALVGSAERLAGPDRFATAAAIARAVEDRVGPVRRVVIARGDAFPDALAAANLATAGPAPILLTATDALPAATAEAVGDVLADGGEVVVVGGPSAVSPAVGSRLAELVGPDRVTRLQGGSRYATAAAVLELAVAEGVRPTPLLVASGERFADALVAGPAAAALGGALALAHPTTLDASPDTRDLLLRLTALGHPAGDVLLVGGPAAISDAVLAELAADRP